MTFPFRCLLGRPLWYLPLNNMGTILNHLHTRREIITHIVENVGFTFYFLDSQMEDLLLLRNPRRSNCRPLHVV